MTVQTQRPSGVNVGVNNPGEIIYIKGNETTDGSFRVTLNGANTLILFEERVGGTWVGADIGVDTNLTEGQVPKADATGILEYGGATVDPVTGEWTFDKTINVGNQKVSLLGTSEIEIFTASDFDDLATAGVITLTQPTAFAVKNAFSTATRVVTNGHTVSFSRPPTGEALTYTGTGTFITSTSATVLIEGPLAASSTGTLLDVTGDNQTFISVNQTLLTGWDMGTVSIGPGVSSGPLIFFTSITALNFQASLVCNNVSVVGFFDVALVPFAGVTDNFIEVLGNQPGSFVFNSVSGSLGASENFIRIDPAIADASNVLITGSTIAGDLFNTAGVAGTFSAVADAAVGPTVITSVTNNGGVARFNFTPGPTVFVGQELTTDSFVVVDYNTTGTISATGAGFFEIVSVSFSVDDTGNFSGNSVTMTDTATTLGEGDSLTISTDNVLMYDGGATVYNQLTNSFQINRTFDATATGSWDTAGLDHTDPKVLASNNPSFAPSTSKIEVSITSNVLVTAIPAAGAKVLINTSSWVATSQERFKLSAPDEAIYFGKEPVSVKLDGNVLLEPASSTKDLSCQFVRQDLARVVVTFTNGTNVVNETAHTLTNGQNLTFHDGVGTLPAELRGDIIYYVVGVTINTFQLSYTSGGAAVAFTDNGSGTNTYAMADLHGSNPREPIAANNPRTLVPQAIEDIEKGDKTFIVVTNNDDAANIEVVDAYYRVSL